MKITNKARVQSRLKVSHDHIRSITSATSKELQAIPHLSKFDDEACKKGEDPEGEVCSNDVAPGAEMWLDHFEYTCNYEVGSENDTHCARCRVPLKDPETPVDMMHQGQPVSCLLKNVVVVEDREMEHRIPEGDIGPDFGKHGKHLCKGPSKDGNVCANAGTDREAYCTYSLGPALYPEEFPVDYHFCAYCADDNLDL